MNAFEWLPGAINILSLVVSGGVLLLVAVLWFFINRASVRASEQIALLEQLIDLQKRQNSLLRRLCEANEPDTIVEKKQEVPQDRDDSDLVGMIAER
ncbi:YebO family protein [Citrobacter sp. JGM124]|uniref:YebO family protein n=1 Tax=Citrobacter sp. JGM124 TaxID=2799789 RepID=UPI001BA6BFB0|nr:YebO family protein [Citrobacter sp. JGM124]MBS0847102.1 YebO family protein [Citrobacter sp. JGM124]